MYIYVYTFRRKHYPKGKKLTAILITLFMTVVCSFRSFHARIGVASLQSKSHSFYSNTELWNLSNRCMNTRQLDSNWRHASKNSLTAEIFFSTLQIEPDLLHLILCFFLLLHPCTIYFIFVLVMLSLWWKKWVFFSVWNELLGYGCWIRENFVRSK